MEEITLADLKRLRLADGDTLAIETPDHLTADQRDRIRRNAEIVFAGLNVRVLLLDGGMRLAAVLAADGPRLGTMVAAMRAGVMTANEVRELEQMDAGPTTETDRS